MKKTLFVVFCTLLSIVNGMAQRPADSAPKGEQEESWVLTVNQLDDQSRRELNRIIEGVQARGGASRGVVKEVLKSALNGGVTGLVDVVTTEVINLAHFKKSQRQKWEQMIMNECNYADSISSVRGLQDFYADVSEMGALDPSNLNFNGISIRGIRDGQEVLYMSCHIDMDRLDHMLQHSKFNLVLDTLAFYPYACHLPNLQANGIYQTHFDGVERDNSFSFDERKHLSVGMELTLTSSWINEAIMVMDNVELGRFSLNVSIDEDTSLYTYSRRQILANRANGLSRDTTFVNIDGDCFVVPRSYMPVSGGKRMWGTGEYNIKVKFFESCQFNRDENHNQKMKHWYKDYKQLRKMQKKGGMLHEYLQTVWRQNGNTIIKQMLRPALTTGVQYTGVSGTNGAAAMGGMMNRTP